MPSKRRLLPVLATAAVLLGLAAAPALARAGLVLGSHAFAGKYGEGWGKVEPAEIFNGGDPSGSVRNIKWRNWGDPTAIGHGLNPIFKPHGGYYRKPARIELRATEIGRCSGHRAYRKLEVRIPKKPGGKLGPWFSWSGADNICESAFG
jgi:hypothetical protein